jgi:hypothetical protein
MNRKNIKPNGNKCINQSLLPPISLVTKLEFPELPSTNKITNSRMNALQKLENNQNEGNKEG